MVEVSLDVGNREPFASQGFCNYLLGARLAKQPPG
jgi:hypothetical protein